MLTNKPANIDEYISRFSGNTKKTLEKVRTAIKKRVPEAEETISYSIPCFKLNGRYLIYFAGYKNHIGIYPVPTNSETFEKAFSAYKTSGKGTLQLPLDKPVPLNLLAAIVKFRVKENLKREKKQQLLTKKDKFVSQSGSGK